MEFSTYQEASSETAKGYADVENVQSVHDRHLHAMFLALALNGEAGEFAEKVKKYVREGDSDYLDEAYYELGDILWYWMQFVTLLGADADVVAEDNIDKLLDREQRDKIFGEGDER